jgi:hypothetical protein
MMNIGIITDGQAEAIALQKIVKGLRTNADNIISPVYADLQPKAAPGQIARAASSRIGLLIGRGADRIIVIVDREDDPTCPAMLALNLETAFNEQGFSVCVAIKNRCFENWLIADPQAFRSMRARFSVSRSFVRSVSPNRADANSNPCRLINRIVRGQGGEYHKRKDACNLASKLNVEEAARNSRSFRRFLRHVYHPDYLDQSKNPV